MQAQTVPHKLYFAPCIETCLCCSVHTLYLRVCLLLEWEVVSDLMDGGGGGGSAPLIAATGSTSLLINL